MIKFFFSIQIMIILFIFNKLFFVHFFNYFLPFKIISLFLLPIWIIPKLTKNFKRFLRILAESPSLFYFILLIQLVYRINHRRCLFFSFFYQLLILFKIALNVFWKKIKVFDFNQVAFLYQSFCIILNAFVKMIIIMLS